MNIFIIIDSLTYNVVAAYLFESSVHGPDFLLGELCISQQFTELNGLLVLDSHPLGDHLLDVKPKVNGG